MRTCQRKLRVVVIECGRYPSCGRVANRAIRRESRRDVIRIRSAVELRHVARVAIRRQGRVIVVHMTSRARRGYVRPSQRKLRVVVIE